jgi:peroxiredoxin
MSKTMMYAMMTRWTEAGWQFSSFCHRSVGSMGLACLLLAAPTTLADDTPPSASDPIPASTTPAPGHSFHDEAFNEGPRQAAYLMPGMGNVHWKISTPSPMAQRFFDQGIVQLHGFWYFEAERSFRQAAAIDPDCPMHYWGMARANVENPERSAGFSEQATRRIEQAKPLERRLIEAWNRRVKDWPTPKLETEKKTDTDQSASTKPKKPPVTDEIRDKRKQRLKDYAKDLEEICQDFPNEVEVKAMLVLQYWQNQGQGIDIQSHLGLDSLLSDIFRANPKHPAHHFRIHLWDYRKEDLALSAAAACGPSAPGIAHMWHMPGHTYSRLHRYDDAAWQQEASARVDHAHMIRDRVMPDQIHNYAHNNEWLIRNWLSLGRVSAAIDLAKNMIELPRHPEYNALQGNGSAALGRTRLVQSLRSYRRWEDWLQLADSSYLAPRNDPTGPDEVHLWKAIASIELKRLDEATPLYEAMRESYRTLEREIQAAGSIDKKITPPPALSDPSDVPPNLLGPDGDPPFTEKINKEFNEDSVKDKSDEDKKLAREQHARRYRAHRLLQYLAAIESHMAAARGEYRLAVRRSHDARGLVEDWQRIEWCSLAGEHKLAIQRADKWREAQGEILPLAMAIWLYDRAIDNAPTSQSTDAWREALQKACEAYVKLLAKADRSEPLLERAKAIGVKRFPEMAWEAKAEIGPDLGARPPLDSLGPVRWTPAAAPMWSVTSSKGEHRSSEALAGKPYVIVLYLGLGCLHCAEQLEKFSPQKQRFAESGIEVLGISTESPESLVEAMKNYSGTMEIPLAPNAELDLFKAFRCFDDFEGQPLHGTILVDGQGRIRWQDIGHEPFMDIDFLHEEAKRLLKLP